MSDGVGAALTTGVAWSGQVLVLAVLVGLIMRRRYRACYTFVLYLLAVLAADLLLLLGPKSLESPGLLFDLLGKNGFRSMTFWSMKELAINFVRFAVALELAFRTFRAFPGARSTARGVVFLLLGITLVSVVAVTPPDLSGSQDDTASQILGRIQPRVLNGTVWLLTGIAAVVLWYRLPVDRFHKAILTGLVPFLLIFTIALNLIESNNWWSETPPSVNYMHTVAYLALLAYWTRAAWAPFRAPAQAAEPVLAFERPVS